MESSQIQELFLQKGDALKILESLCKSLDVKALYFNRRFWDEFYGVGIFGSDEFDIIEEMSVGKWMNIWEI